LVRVVGFLVLVIGKDRLDGDVSRHVPRRIALGSRVLEPRSETEGTDKGTN
jgi:hypothetical protein